MSVKFIPSYILFFCSTPVYRGYTFSHIFDPKHFVGIRYNRQLVKAF